MLFVTAVRRNRRRLWLCYAPRTDAVDFAEPESGSAGAGPCAMLPWLAPKKSRKSPTIWWAVGVAVAVGIMTPFIVFAHGQVRQVELDLSDQLALRL